MDSSEDLAANLKNYEIQLQQVIAALESDSDNEELIKLKADLEEVINLTKDLMGSNSGEATGNVATESANHGSGSFTTHHQFKTGDRVLAPWSVDGLYYEARIDDLTSDGQCTVSFSSAVLGTDDGKLRNRDKSASEVCLVDLLKPFSSNSSTSSDPSHRGSNSKRNAAHMEKHKAREHSKAKQQKRSEKFQSLDEERERDKRKWQDFAMGKKGAKKKGLTSASGSKTRVSIFASPDGVDGRVGVGTCGISGKPMTPYVPTTTVVASALATHKKKTLASGLPSID